MKLDEIAGITLEIRRMEKLTEALTKKVLGLEEQRKEVDVARDKLKMETSTRAVARTPE